MERERTDRADAIRKLLELKMNPTRLAILLYLVARGEVRFKELCEELGLTPGNAWSHLEKMKKEGLITMRRELSSSGSKVIVKLTQKGYTKADLILAVISELSNLRDLVPSALQSAESPERD